MSYIGSIEGCRLEVDSMIYCSFEAVYTVTQTISSITYIETSLSLDSTTIKPSQFLFSYAHTLRIPY